jgi:5'(3')-deoxyribonucleotidase
MFKIALDVDSVLADVIVVWLDIFGDLYGQYLTKHEVNTWDFWKGLNLTYDQFSYIFTKTWSQWKRIPPTENGLAEKVRELQTIGEVDIVTGRSLETVPNVKKWLEHEGIGYTEFVLVPPRSLKSELEYNVFIDDSPYNVVGAATSNRYSILYDQPWNQDVKHHPNIFRANDLSTSISIIRSLVRMKKYL